MRLTIVLGLALAALTALRSPARADGDVGVIVTGEGSMQPQLAAQIADWLSRHGHTLVPSPLPSDAITALIDCVVIADRGCAREIVEKRGKSTRMVFAQVDSKNDAGSGTRDVTLTAYWFDKGHDAVAERKICQRCTAQSLRLTADEIMRKLVGSGNGQVKLKSNPMGAIIIDGQAIGVTPLDWDLPRGKHAVEMDKPGFLPASREIVVMSDQTDIVAMDLAPAVQPERGTPWSRIVPIAMVIGGGAAVVAGGVMVAIDQDLGPPEPPVIRNTAPAGVALMIGGAVVGGAGAYLLWFRSPRMASTPVASISSDSAYVGWLGQF
jgi:hypothetical protein